MKKHNMFAVALFLGTGALSFAGILELVPPSDVTV